VDYHPLLKSADNEPDGSLDREVEEGGCMAGQRGDHRPHAIGVFHAIKTRDHQARLRDGHPYYVLNDQGEDHRGDHLFEVCFGDGTWMLAGEADLQPFEQLP
jgi:hypothetical protein